VSARWRSAQAQAAWLFVVPALVLIGVFFVLPVVAGLVLSLTDFDLYAIGDPGIARVVGLRNYHQVLTDAEFWNALRNTLYFVFAGGPLSLALSLGAALLVNAKRARFPGVFRVLFFTPVVTTLVAVAIVWRYLYHPHYGLIDLALGRLGIRPIDWLGDPHWAMLALILLSAWKNFGYNMLIFVAGLQSIPEDLYDAARLDGAGAWARFVTSRCPRCGRRCCSSAS
jgi:multiple sugar transport system permease protein